MQHPKGGLITILEDNLGWSAFDLPDNTVTTSDKDTNKYPVKTLSARHSEQLVTFYKLKIKKEEKSLYHKGISIILIIFTYIFSLNSC